jgi:exodeoxyribonuclease V beta subunit
MTFELPVRTAAGAVSLHDVGTVMLEFLPAADPYRAYAERLTALPINRFRGYMTGAIDFTTVMPDGRGRDRFVVMDYKSNALQALGEEPSTSDYGGPALAAAMSDGNYVLQALLYQVALHRYLQWRLPAYDPATHLGGSAYLFVRGMVGPDTPVVEGARCGVARWEPPAEMIVAVSRLFAGEGP